MKVGSLFTTEALLSTTRNCCTYGEMANVMLVQVGHPFCTNSVGVTADEKASPVLYAPVTDPFQVITKDETQPSGTTVSFNCKSQVIGEINGLSESLVT